VVQVLVVAAVAAGEDLSMDPTPELAALAVLA